MNFKFSIFLLACLIFAESMDSTDDLDILRKAFFKAKRMYRVPMRRDLTESEWATFFGSLDVSELKKIANAAFIPYLRDDMNLERFKMLAIEFCNSNGISIRDNVFPKKPQQVGPSNMLDPPL